MNTKTNWTQWIEYEGREVADSSFVIKHLSKLNVVDTK